MKTRFVRLFSPLILGLVVSVLAGCAGPHVWSEDKAANPRDLTAITGDWEHNYRIYIIQVDEKPTRSSGLSGLTQTVYLKPGQHTLFIGYENDIEGSGAYGYGSFHSFRTIRFIAQAGKSYAIHRKLVGYNIEILLEESGDR